MCVCVCVCVCVRERERERERSYQTNGFSHGWLNFKQSTSLYHVRVIPRGEWVCGNLQGVLGESQINVHILMSLCVNCLKC